MAFVRSVTTIKANFEELSTPSRRRGRVCNRECIDFSTIAPRRRARVWEGYNDPAEEQLDALFDRQDRPGTPQAERQRREDRRGGAYLRMMTERVGRHGGCSKHGEPVPREYAHGLKGA